MAGIAVKNDKRGLIWASLVFACVASSSLSLSAPVSAETSGTSITTTVCLPSSTVTLSSPVSDSIVTQSTIAIAGTVAQASQIEVYIDGNFNNVIPLSIGQTSYDGSVQLGPGTHTIMVKAVSTCSGPEGTASSVVTYQPVSTGSVGNKTPTGVGGVEVGGEPLPESLNVEPIDEGMIPLGPFKPILEWLNVKTSDSSDTTKLSIWRAIVIGVGMYLMVVGVAGVVISAVVSLPAITGVLGSLSLVGRQRILGWVFRIIGLIIVVLALLL